MFSVPSTFTAFDVSGSCTERGTEPSAPRWNTTSTPRTAAWQRSYERSSPSTISTSSPSRLSRLPVAKLSSTRTSWPRSSNPRTRFDPMKPAPPVTSTFIRGNLQPGCKRTVLQCSRLEAAEANSPELEGQPAKQRDRSDHDAHLDDRRRARHLDELDARQDQDER